MSQLDSTCVNHPKSSVAKMTSPGEFARLLRRRQKLTLEQLAQSIGLSKGHLSRFERGEKALSVAALIRLSEALGTKISILLGETSSTDAVHILRASDRVLLTSVGPDGEFEYTYSSLNKTQIASDYTVFVVHLEAGVRVGKEAYHGGEEIFYVLSGALEMEFESHTVVLRAGDYAQFPGHIKHHLLGAETGTSVLITIIGDQ